MRTVRWVVAVLAVAVLLYTCALPGDLPADTDTTGGLVGTYTTNGVHPTGGEFGGTAIITDSDRAGVYTIDLIITGGIQRQTAVRSGDRLAVTWETVAAASDRPLTGTGDYVIEPDGRITGTWRVDGSDLDGTIELFPDA